MVGAAAGAHLRAICETLVGRSAEAKKRFDRAKKLLMQLGATPTIDEIDGVADQAAAL